MSIAIDILFLISSFFLFILDYLTEALKSTNCNKIKVSLIAQRDFHLSQELVLRKRKVSFLKQLETQKQLRQELLAQAAKNKKGQTKMNEESERKEDKRGNTTEEASTLSKMELEKEINRWMDEQDSLLQFLINRRKEDEGDKNQESTATIAASGSNELLYKSGSKMAKDDKTKIEELQVVNEKLRQLVYQLLGELEKAHKENTDLKQEINELNQELDKGAYGSSVPDLPPLEPPTLLY